ncbi:MAG: PAS domain S-box protein, partial [Deltaproteobacteria bacterium]
TQAGTLMYVPVYRKGMPTDSVEQRRAAIYGWVYSPYRMNDLMRGMLGDINSHNEKRLHMQIFDGANAWPQDLLYEDHSAKDEKLRPEARFTEQIPVDFNGHRWTLSFTQTGAGPMTEEYTRAWLTLGGGTIIVLLLFALISALQNTRDKAQRMAEELTVDLRESEETHRLLIKNSHDVIYTLNSDGVFTFVSPAWTALLGHPLNRVMGQPFQEFVHPDDIPGCMVFLKKVIETGQRQKGVEYRVRHADGSWYWHTSGAVPLRDEAGKVVGFEGTARDITERRKAEEALLFIKNKLELALSSAGMGVWQFNSVDNKRIFDKQTCGLLGLDPRTFDGSSEEFFAVIHPEDREKVQAALKQTLEQHAFYRPEYRVVWPDGSIHHIAARGELSRDDQGAFRGINGILWDITESKKAEEALKEKEANFRTFFETVTDMILVGLPDGRLLFTNDAATRTLGYTQDELKQMRILDLHPADKRLEAEAIFAAMFKGERQSCPLPLARKDGVLIPVETCVWFGRWNGRDCIFGLSKNLSAEQEAQQRFERLFRNNPALMALSTLPDRRFSDVNDIFLKKLGYSRGEILGKTAGELGLFPQAERQAVIENKLQAEGRIADLELQVRGKDGAILEGLFSGELISSQGRQHFLTVMSDITERKKSEALLEQATNRLRLATRAGGVGIWDYDVVHNKLIWD